MHSSMKSIRKVDEMHTYDDITSILREENEKRKSICHQKIYAFKHEINPRTRRNTHL